MTESIIQGQPDVLVPPFPPTPFPYPPFPQKQEPIEDFLGFWGKVAIGVALGIAIVVAGGLSSNKQ